MAYVLANYSGMFHYLVQLSNAMSKYADVTVIGPKDIDYTYFSPNVRVESVLDCSMKKKASISRKVLGLGKLRVLRKIKPDIIHITDFQPIIALGLYLFRLNRNSALVYTDHDVSTGSHTDKTLEKLSESFGNFLNQHLLNYDKFIVHGDFLKNCMVSKGVPENKIGVIPHGSYTLFENYGSDQKIIEEKNTILFFGFIKEYKGLQYLIKAVPIITAQIPDLKVIIAGQGNLNRYFNGKSAPSQFEIHNELIPDENVRELFCRSQLLVLPYIEASQSGPLHIAFAVGKPVVATSVGSLPEVIKDGKNGFLVPPRDEKALADAIITLLKSDDLRSEMGKNAYYIATHELSWDTISRKTLDLYKEVLETRSLKQDT